MIRFINNWVFTLIETVLFAAFAVLMLVPFESRHILFGIALSVYTVVFVLSKVMSYRGMIQLIAIIEFFVSVIMIIFVMADGNTQIFPGVNIVNTAIGFAMWIRATTEILHSYFGQGEGRVAKRQFNGWKIFVYILLLSFGTFVATNAVISDNLFRYIIAGIAAASAIIMGVLTYTNHADYRAAHPKPIKAVPQAQDELKGDDKNGSLKEKNAASALPAAEKQALPAAKKTTRAPRAKKTEGAVIEAVAKPASDDRK